ncbi:MAG: hypothetical protein ACI87W_002599 [Halieaceae bacterium]|jgi:hypothetical protein
MNDDFGLVDADDQPVSYSEGTLIAVPAEDECFVEFSGITEDDYKTHFGLHLDAMSSSDTSEGDASAEAAPDGE